MTSTNLSLINNLNQFLKSFITTKPGIGHLMEQNMFTHNFKITTISSCSIIVLVMLSWLL